MCWDKYKEMTPENKRQMNWYKVLLRIKGGLYSVYWNKGWEYPVDEKILSWDYQVQSLTTPKPPEKVYWGEAQHKVPGFQFFKRIEGAIGWSRVHTSYYNAEIWRVRPSGKVYQGFIGINLSLDYERLAVGSSKYITLLNEVSHENY